MLEIETAILSVHAYFSSPLAILRRNHENGKYSYRSLTIFARFARIAHKYFVQGRIRFVVNPKPFQYIKKTQ